jgi:hypothetical protein
MNMPNDKKQLISTEKRTCQEDECAMIVFNVTDVTFEQFRKSSLFSNYISVDQKGNLLHFNQNGVCFFNPKES